MSQVKARQPQAVKKAQPSRRVITTKSATKPSFGQWVAKSLGLRSSSKLPRDYPLPRIPVVAEPVRVAIQMPGTSDELPEPRPTKAAIWAQRTVAPKPQIAHPVAPAVLNEPKPVQSRPLVKIVSNSGQAGRYMSDLKAPVLTASRRAYASEATAHRGLDKVDLKAASPIVRLSVRPEATSTLAPVIHITPQY